MPFGSLNALIKHTWQRKDIRIVQRQAYTVSRDQTRYRHAAQHVSPRYGTYDSNSSTSPYSCVSTYSASRPSVQGGVCNAAVDRCSSHRRKAVEDDGRETFEAASREEEKTFRNRMADVRHARVKQRADRSYSKYYEGAKPAEAVPDGPRAAVYKGEMGAVHKRSFRMQGGGDGKGHRAKKRVGGAGAHSGRMGMPALIALACAVFLVFGCVYLYAPAQQLYIDIREKDRLTAEYDAIVQRNENISRQVDVLQTDAGVEDVARKELGWVREGEHAVNVSGLPEADEPAFQGNIVSENVSYPDTWYSGVLDPLFGVE